MYSRPSKVGSTVSASHRVRDIQAPELRAAEGYSTARGRATTQASMRSTRPSERSNELTFSPRLNFGTVDSNKARVKRDRLADSHIRRTEAAITQVTADAAEQVRLKQVEKRRAEMYAVNAVLARSGAAPKAAEGKRTKPASTFGAEQNTDSRKVTAEAVTPDILQADGRASEMTSASRTGTSSQWRDTATNSLSRSVYRKRHTKDSALQHKKSTRETSRPRNEASADDTIATKQAAPGPRCIIDASTQLNAASEESAQVNLADRPVTVETSHQAMRQNQQRVTNGKPSSLVLIEPTASGLSRARAEMAATVAISPLLRKRPQNAALAAAPAHAAATAAAAAPPPVARHSKMPTAEQDSCVAVVGVPAARSAVSTQPAEATLSGAMSLDEMFAARQPNQAATMEGIEAEIQGVV
jgi:hypothetical protein